MLGSFVSGMCRPDFNVRQNQNSERVFRLRHLDSYCYYHRCAFGICLARRQVVQATAKYNPTRLCSSRS